MDIAELKQKLLALLSHHGKGESYESFWLQQRKYSPKHPEFWRVVIWILKKLLIRVLSTSLNLCEKIAIARSFLLPRAVLNSFATIEDSPPKIEQPRYEVVRDPPDGFVSVPKVEIGGCARSDSLIRSLVF